MDDKRFKDLNFSLLGKNSHLNGEFSFQGDTYLNCKVEGKITMKDTGKVTIERGAEVNADIYCHDIEVFGEFAGSINASGTLTARSSAKISGLIKANSISIFPGAEINMEGHTEEGPQESH